MRAFRRSLLPLLIIFAATLIVYTLFIRPWHLRWGATVEETTMAMPGDIYIPTETISSTRAITIHAPRAIVWAWLVQLGQGRGGFYSYEWLENLFAAEMHNANQIIPELQDLKIGDHVSYQQDGPYAVVARADANQMLMLEGGWTWYLQEIDTNTTRLVVRYASFKVNSVLSSIFYYSIFEPAHFVMEQGMMLGIKTRSEQLWLAQSTNAAK